MAKYISTRQIGNNIPKVGDFRGYNAGINMFAGLVGGDGVVWSGEVGLCVGYVIAAGGWLFFICRKCNAKILYLLVNILILH